MLNIQKVIGTALAGLVTLGMAGTAIADPMRYGNRSVIRDLSLTIEPGEMVGLVGYSGSGKSMLVNLICRFYDVTEGAILVDGVD